MHRTISRERLENRHDAPSTGQLLLFAGVMAAAGAALYYAFRYGRDLRAQTYSPVDRAAVRRLYQAHRNPSEEERRPATRRRDCDLPENSAENLDKKLDHALKETFPTSDPVSVSITR